MFESLPARIVLGLYSALMVLVIVTMAVNKTNVSAFFFAFVSIPMGLLYVYDLNCTFVGQCVIWGWIRSLAFILFLFIAVVVMFFVMMGSIYKQLKP